MHINQLAMDSNVNVMNHANNASSGEKIDMHGPIIPRVMKQGWLRKRSQKMPVWKTDEYFALLENGKFLSFMSKPDSSMCCAMPKHVFLLRSLPCLGVTSSLDYCTAIDVIQVEENNNNINIEKDNGCQKHCLVEVQTQRNTFSVRILRNDTDVEKTYLASDATDRDEWTKAFTEVKRLLSLKQKNLDDFEMLTVLGAGYFGKVVLCQDKSTCRPYAMKIIKKSKIAGIKELNHTLAEKHFLQKLTHPFLIHMKFSFQTPDKLCFVTEYLPGGELYRIVQNVGHLAAKHVRFYSSEVVSAVGFLHHCNVVYRDLKLENILIDKEGHIRLVDLGLCKDLLSSTQKTRTFCGTRECMAPEVLDCDLYGLSVDWWGLGIIMYEMLCGHVPYRDETVQGLLHKIKNEELEFTRQLPDDAVAIVKGLLQKNPQARLGCGEKGVLEVQAHSFFSEINWDDVNAKKLIPPFVPELSSDVDTVYFDDFFTSGPVQTINGEPGPALTSMERNKFEKISDYSDSECSSSGSELSEENYFLHI